MQRYSESIVDSVEKILKAQIASFFDSNDLRRPEVLEIVRGANRRQDVFTLSSVFAGRSFAEFSATPANRLEVCHTLRELGDAYLALQKPEEAMLAFGRMSEADSEMRVAKYLGLACCALDLRQYADASEWAKRAAASLETKDGYSTSASIIYAAAEMWLENIKTSDKPTFEIVIFCHVTNKLERYKHLSAPDVGLVALACSSLREALDVGPDIPMTIYYDHRISLLNQEYLLNLSRYCLDNSIKLAVNTKVGLRVQWLSAFAEARAQYVMVVEQDHQFFASGFTYRDILRALESRPDIGQVRLNRRSNIPKHWDSPMGQTSEDILSGWSRVPAFSNSVNIIRRTYYERIIYPIIHNNTSEDFTNGGAGGVEGNVIRQIDEFLDNHGVEATLRIFGQAIWGAPGRGRVCQHTGQQCGFSSWQAAKASSENQESKGDSQRIGSLIQDVVWKLEAMTFPDSSDHGQLERTGVSWSFDCPNWDGAATGRGAKPPHRAASRHVAEAGAALVC
ncbi:hypothetical protein FGO68_gene6401 [Halteria grandinella]|uniref:Uncharacterized protein n=1 Tax=Halteria grandinella TaxID=5974 RepID=A0A8J8NAU6_HALGN|nr:hypothetical protein FGO68_gene6401 [Halteria grandinella]